MNIQQNQPLRNSFPPVVQKTIEEFGCLMEEVLDFSQPDQRGNWYYRGDTGTGKTTAIMWHVARNNSSRFVIAVPTRLAADQLYAQLKSWGVDVAVWTQAHDLRHPERSEFEPSGRFFKDQLAGYRVVIGTHKFLLSATNNVEKSIGQRDLLIVDEVPSQFDGAEKLELSDFTKAWEEAHALELSAKAPLNRVKAWAEGIVQVAEGKSQFEKPELSERADEWRQIAAGLARENATDEGRAAMAAVTNFVLASFEGRAFAQIRDSAGRRRVVFYTTRMHLPSVKRAIHVSATVHLEGWQVSPYCDQLRESRGQQLDYRNLTIMADGWSKHLPTNYADLLSKPKALRDYKQWVVEVVLKTPKDSKILLVVPAKLVDHTREALGDRSLMFEEHRLDVRVTHFKVDVGSNEYRDCTDVILLGLHHAPKASHIQRGFQFSQVPVSQNILNEQGGRLEGIFREVQHGDLKAQIKQLGARGRVRMAYSDGTCGEMRLWTYQNDVKPQELLELFPNANLQPSSGAFRQRHGVRHNCKSLAEAVVEGLNSLTPDVGEITVRDLGYIIDKTDLFTRGSRLSKLQETWAAIGWTFRPGVRGRGDHPSRFIRVESQCSAKPG